MEFCHIICYYEQLKVIDEKQDRYTLYIHKAFFSPFIIENILTATLGHEVLFNDAVSTLKINQNN
jgi:hypothetical protein